MVNLEALTSYKIIYSGVDEKPEIKCKCLKRLVGANGFEPSTSWSRTRRASQAALRPDRQAELSASHFASRLAQLSTHSYTRLVPCLLESCSLRKACGSPVDHLKTVLSIDGSQLTHYS